MKSRLPHILLVAMQCLMITTTYCQTASVVIKGYVFVDKNNNGIRDKNEAGLKDVQVSDQSQIVTTGADGSYALTSNDNHRNIYITQPEGYSIRGSFFKPRPDQAGSAIDFPLIPIGKVTTFTFIHASDTHVSEQSLPRLERLRAISDSLKPAFVLVTGDLIKDALRVGESEATRLFEMYQNAIQKFTVPIWNVPGNHEIFGIERHKSLVNEKHPLYGKEMYRHYLGPDYYSFNYGGVHFIGLNSVDYHDLWYYGHIDSTQLSWLTKEVASVPKSKPIITFNHIPFFSGGMSMAEYSDEEPGSVLINVNGVKLWRHVVTNADQVMNVFKDHNFPVALSGHYHYAQTFNYESNDSKTEFHQTGAVVGPSTHSGIVMPSGVILYTVTDGKIVGRKFIGIDL